MNDHFSYMTAVCYYAFCSSRRVYRFCVGLVLVCSFLYPASPTLAQELKISCTGVTCPILETLADAYRTSNPSASIGVTSASSSEAIKILQTQRIDLVMLDRSATYTEAVRTQSLVKRDLVGTPFAMTGVGIYVHASHPAKSLTLEQLRKLFQFEVISWDELGFEADGTVLSEYRPEGVKLARGSVPIRLYLPSNKLGVNDILSRRLLAGQSWSTRVTLFDTADSLLDKIAADSHGIGVAALTSHDNVKALAIQTSENVPAISPTLEAIKNRTYPLSHYLYFYSLGQPSGPAKDFTMFVLSEPGQRLVDDKGPTLTSLAFDSKP